MILKLTSYRNKNMNYHQEDFSSRRMIHDFAYDLISSCYTPHFYTELDSPAISAVCKDASSHLDDCSVVLSSLNNPWLIGWLFWA